MAQPAPDTLPAHPLFSRLPGQPATWAQASVSLPTFTESWNYFGNNYFATIVGTQPATGGASTTVPVYLIPIKLVIGATRLDPKTVQANGKTAVANTLASPIFRSGIDFVQGGTKLGKTQYIDAFQRANYWGALASNPGWHLLLGKPTVLPEHTVTVPSASGSIGTEFGIPVGLADYYWFDGIAKSILAAETQIQPDSLVLFITYNTFLTENGSCCIGGYHSAAGAQTYSHFTYIPVPGIFSQDVSALSHEVGEWAEDPFVNNYSQPCGGLLEVGDPLENMPNYGAYPYTLNNFVYHLQDLVLLPYFGAPSSISVNGWSTFQGTPVSVCEYGQ